MLKVHSLRVKNFAGIHEATLELQDNGVTVIYGPNEAGKSTMLKAFELLLSDTLVRSTKADVKRHYPRDRDENPTVSADLTVGSYRLTMEKTYKAGSGSAVLKIVEPKPDTLTGRDAENRFQEILNAETDRTLIQALTIHQGESLDEFAALDVTSLANVMSECDGCDAEAGDGAGEGSAATVVNLATNNAHTAGLLKAIEAEYSRYWTSTGRVLGTSDFRKKKDAVEDARQQLADAETTYREAQTFIDKLDQLEAEQGRIAEQLPEAREAVGRREQEFRAAESVASKLQQLKDKVTAAGQQHALVSDRLKHRQELVQQHAAEQHEVEQRATALTAAQKAHEEETQSNQERDQRIGQLEQAVDRAQAVRGAVVAAHRRVELAEAWETDRALVESVSEMEGKRKQLDEQLAANTAAPALMSEFRRALANLDAMTQLRDSQATNLHIAGPAQDEVTDDAGQRYPLGEEGIALPIASKRVLTMGEYTVTVTPAKDQADQERAVQRAAQTLAMLSKKLGVDNGDSDAAEALADERLRVENELTELKLALSQKSAGRSVESIRADLGHHQSAFSDAHNEVMDACTAVESFMPAAGDDHGVAEDVASAWKRVQAQNAALETAEADHQAQAVLDLDTASGFAAVVRQSQEAVDTAEKALRAENARGKGTSDVARNFFEARAAHTSAEKTAAKLLETLTAAREVHTDQALAEFVERAQSEVDAAQAAFTQAREEHTGIDAESARDAWEAAQTRVKNLEERLHAIDRDTSANEAYLDGRSDAADRRDNARAEVHRAESEYARIEAQAEAARLLRETVLAARAEMQAQYEKPFKDAFEQIAQVVYGEGISFELADDFSVEKRVLNGMDLEPEQLSGGAKEQMLILARIAVATLVGGGEAVPIFIDDALGFSDAHRIEAMNNVLGRLGRKNQVVVLTCDVERFDGIPGARQLSIDSVKSAG